MGVHEFEYWEPGEIEVEEMLEHVPKHLRFRAKTRRPDGSGIQEFGATEEEAIAKARKRYEMG